VLVATPGPNHVVLAGRALYVPKHQGATVAHVNRGHRPKPLTCATAGERATQQRFPSSRRSRAVIGLAVPGRPIRSLVAEDRSAAGIRDRKDPNPMLTRFLTTLDGRPRDGPVQGGIGAVASTLVEGLIEPRTAPTNTRVGNLIK
jgi:hypothetical protein